MPDTPVDRRGEAPYPPDLEGRVRALEDLATRTTAAIETLNRQVADLAAEQHGLREDMNAAIGGLRAEVNSAVGGLRADVNAAVGEFRAEVTAALRGIQADMHAESRSTRADISAMRAEHRSDFRMLLGLMIGLAAAGFGLIAHGFHWLP